MRDFVGSRNFKFSMFNRKQQILLLTAVTFSLSAIFLNLNRAVADTIPMMKAVGVLANTSGLSNKPVPFAMYTGIAIDRKGRVYLAGAEQGVVVTDEIGKCLTIIPLPESRGLKLKSIAAFNDNKVFVVAIRGQGTTSALYSIDTTPAGPDQLQAVKIAEGPGHWAVSPTPDRSGRVIIGKSLVDKLSYSVDAIDAKDGKSTLLFTAEMPKGTMHPWRHSIQAESDGIFNIMHLGGVNWNGRFKMDGTRIGNAVHGQLFEGYRYIFGYSGNVKRMSPDGTKAEPGDCGTDYQEPRMFTQITKAGDRFYFSGRGGATIADWKNNKFEYKRRIGGIFIEDFSMARSGLCGTAYQLHGSFDVPHVIHIPVEHPVGKPLDIGQYFHDRTITALVPVHDKALICIYRKNNKKIGVCYAGKDRGWQFDKELSGIKEIGQATISGRDLLVADPATGTIWKRPLLDKTADLAPMKTGLPGIIGLSCLPDSSAICAATPTKVMCLSADGSQIKWQTPDLWKGILRIAATMNEVYVCDEQNHVVDKLDVKTGRLLARFGAPGEAGATLDRLSSPHAVAADANGVYIADNGNGRILIATTTAWRPEIMDMPVDDDSPVKAIQIPVNPPAKGRMSLNIYNTADDVTVRQLVCAGNSGKPVIWDGLDMYGKWSKPGTYRYHGAIVPELSLKYITTVSQSGNPPYRTADGRGSWGGVWHFVTDICPVTNAPDSDIAVLWGIEEGEGGLIRMSQDGEVRWKQHLPWWMKSVMMGVCSDGTNIYIAAASALNSPSGQTNYGGSMKRPMLWRVDTATGTMKLYEKDHNAQPMFGEYRKGFGSEIVSDIKYSNGRIYMTAPSQDSVFVVDAATAKQLDTWQIPEASGIAFRDTENCLVGSGRNIMSVQTADGKSKLFADAGGKVRDIAVLVNGDIVASIIAPRHQLVFFDTNGKEKKSLGRAGGRPLCGRMIRDSFRKPAGICVTGNGKIFVSEESAPKRFTRWSQNGVLEQEFHGPYYFSGMFGIDEEIPEHVYADTHGDIIRYILDYDTGKWHVDSYWTAVYNPGDGKASPKWWPRIRHHNGKVWWCGGSGAIVELNEDNFRNITKVYGGWLEKLDDGNYRASRKKTGLKGTWSDLNGDGKEQPGEWQVTPSPAYPIDSPGPQQGWGWYFDENFNLYTHDWSDDAKGGVWKLPVSEWKNGVPVYRWEQASHAAMNRAGLAHGAGGARSAFADEGKVYGFNGGYNSKNLSGVGHGRDWEFAQVTCYDETTGKPLWHAGERCASFANPGQMYCPTGASGVIDDYLFWTDENSLVHAWDKKQGLYVDTLLEDISRAPVPSPYTIWVELFNSRVFKHPKTGKVYLLAASDAIHVFEVLGTEKKIQRFSGEFQLTEKDIDSAKQQLTAKSGIKKRELKIAKIAIEPKIDGNPAEFAKAATASMTLNDNAGGTAKLMIDDKNLYVCFDVKDSSPWKNGGSDISTLFKTGDAVSIWIGPDNKKRRPDENDVRIMFAPTAEGRNVAVAFRPNWPKATKPVWFRSPADSLKMDRVEELPNVQCTVKTTTDGYVLAAAVPLSDIGINGKPGEFGLDLSITFSDPSGKVNNARIHWGRNGAAMVYDLPSEARFEQETWGTGIIK